MTLKALPRKGFVPKGADAKKFLFIWEAKEAGARDIAHLAIACLVADYLNALDDGRDSGMGIWIETPREDESFDQELLNIKLLKRPIEGTPRNARMPFSFFSKAAQAAILETSRSGRRQPSKKDSERSYPVCSPAKRRKLMNRLRDYFGVAAIRRVRRRMLTAESVRVITEASVAA